MASRRGGVRLQGKTQRAHPARLIVCEREERDAEADDPEARTCARTGFARGDRCRGMGLDWVEGQTTGVKLGLGMLLGIAAAMSVAAIYAWLR
jgi:hypothetical protein